MVAYAHSCFSAGQGITTSFFRSCKRLTWSFALPGFFSGDSITTYFCHLIGSSSHGCISPILVSFQARRRACLEESLQKLRQKDFLLVAYAHSCLSAGHGITKMATDSFHSFHYPFPNGFLFMVARLFGLSINQSIKRYHHIIFCSHERLT